MRSAYNARIVRGSLIALIGYILSGPVSFVLVNSIQPQNSWTSSSDFAKHYSSVQDIPYYCGFLLLAGMLMLVSAHCLIDNEEGKKASFKLNLAFASTIIFCTLISFNYVCQTTYIHNLALHYKPEYDIAISMFSMSNPFSFCWMNEMWGYGFLGVATWLMSSYYYQKSRWISNLLVLNGLVSLISVAWTIIDISWVMSSTGIVLYFLWNILMIVLMILIYRFSNQQEIGNK